MQGSGNANRRGLSTPMIDNFRALEESLWRAETRLDDTLMDRTFSADLIEFGRSGRIYQRDEMLLGQNGYGEIRAVLPLDKFSVRSLSDDIVQVTYISEVTYSDDVEFANRPSIWRNEDGKWKLWFHQGTPL